MWLDAVCRQLCTGMMCHVVTNPGGTDQQLWCGESTYSCLLSCTVHCFSCLSPNPRGAGWWLQHGESTELCTLNCFSCLRVDNYDMVNQQTCLSACTVHCFSCLRVDNYDMVNQQTCLSACTVHCFSCLRVDNYDMVNQQTCLSACTVHCSAVWELTIMTWWINRPVYQPVLCTVSAVWAQTPGGAGSQLRRGVWAHEEELSPCGRGRQTHRPSGAWGPWWRLPARCRRSHGQRWVECAAAGSPRVPAPVEIRILLENMSLPKAGEVGVLQERELSFPCLDKAPMLGLIVNHVGPSERDSIKKLKFFEVISESIQCIQK